MDLWMIIIMISCSIICTLATYFQYRNVRRLEKVLEKDAEKSK